MSCLRERPSQEVTNSGSQSTIRMGSAFARVLFVQLPKDLLAFGTAFLAYFGQNYLTGARAMPVGLTHIEEISQLSPRVRRILGMNPGPFTLQGTNTYLVGTGKSKILVDTGQPDVLPYLQNLVKSLEEDESRIEAIVATHWHIDHTGGIAQIRKHYSKLNIPVYKMRRTDGQPEPSGSEEFTFVQDGHILRVEGATLRFLFTPGHTYDHAALWLEEESAIFSGDCVLGEGTAIFENLAQYMDSLRRMVQMKANRIYPGHGPVVENPEEKISIYIEHRLQRENEILGVIGSEGPCTGMNITSSLYKDILPALRLAALHNVQHHLEKLIADGKVRNVGPSIGGIGLGVYELAEVEEEESDGGVEERSKI